MKLHVLATVLLVALTAACAGDPVNTAPQPPLGGGLGDVTKFDSAPGDTKGDGAPAETAGNCGGKPCDDGNPCTDDLCDKGACKASNNKAECDDGDACTGGDLCSAGACKPGKNVCGDTVGGETTIGPDTPPSTGPDLKAGDLVITEILYNPNGKGSVSDDVGEWFEIFNPNEKEVNLTGLLLRDLGSGKHTVAGPATIGAKGFFVFGISADKTKNGGVEVSYAYGTGYGLANTSDAIILESNGIVIDKVAWDQGKGWPKLDGVAMSLTPTQTSATGNDSADVWCGAVSLLPSGDKGTPGKVNDACQSDGDKDGIPDGSDNCPMIANPSQWDANKNGIGDDCEGPVPTCGNKVIDPAETCDDGNKQGGDGCSAWCQPEKTVAAGSLVISEFMSNPAQVADDVGEWIELFNPSAQEVELNGVVLQIGTLQPIKHAIGGPFPIVLPAKGYMLLALSADTAANGGLPKPGYVYSGLAFSSTAATISLHSGGVELDKVTYDKTFPLVTGKSTALEPTKSTAADNDAAANWCKGQAAYGKGDFGSPGVANPSCAGASADDDGDGVPDKADNCKSDKNPGQEDADKDGFGDVCDNCKDAPNAGQEDTSNDGVGDACEKPGCGNGVLEGTEACDDGNLKSGDGCSAGCKVEVPLAEGAVIFTEIMPDPKAVSDDLGEWVELFNTSTVEVDLAGLTVKVGTSSHTILGTKPFVVAAGGYAVLGKSTDVTKNGGAKVDYAYGSVSLANGGTVEVAIEQKGKVIDKVVYGPGLGWPPPTGGSAYQLVPAKLTGTDNDAGANWCLAPAQMAAAATGTTVDYGSPGAVNPACPVDGDGDGIADSKDNCPAKANSTQLDGDKDLVGDACDNCVTVANTDQKDTEGNGTGDACEGLPVCGNGKIEPPETCDDSNKTAGDGCSAACIVEVVAPALKAGDLVITEFMFDPKAADDATGEWFEIRNLTANPIDLNGLVVLGKASTSNDKFTIDGKGKAVVIQPDAYFVLGLSADVAKTGGVKVDYVYSGFPLSNSGNDIIDLQSKGVSVDKIEYTLGSGGWPKVTAGTAFSLSATQTTVLANDSGANWCLAVAKYGAGDLGTPGAVNPSCGPPLPPPPPPKSSGNPGSPAWQPASAQESAFAQAWWLLLQWSMFGW